MVYKTPPEENETGEIKNFTEQELLDLIKRSEKHIFSLSKKFFYFTSLSNEDLEQEGRLKIIEIARRWERGEIKVTREELNRYIGTSLIHLFIDLVRQFPSEKLYDPVYVETFWTSEDQQLNICLKKATSLEECVDYMFIYSLLRKNLNPQEFEVASYFLCDYSREQIAKMMNVGIKRIDAIKAQIKNKLHKVFA